MIAVREPANAAEIFAIKAEVQKRIWSPPRPGSRREGSAPAVKLVQKPEEVIDEASMKPLQFLKHRCRMAGVGYIDITVANRTQRMVKVRDSLMREVTQRFPDIDVAELSRIFKRDRATVYHSLSRIGMFRGERHYVANSAELIRAMLLQGRRISEIAEHIGFSGGAVSDFVRAKGWSGLVKRARRIADCAATIERMFKDGVPQTEIGAAIGYDSSTVCKFVARQGWTR